MRLLIMGLPGAGKGTQAQVVAERLGIPHISTGDIFRANLAQGTPLGQLAQSFMDKGEYVPDEVTNDMVKDRLAQADAKAGFLLDGYPRTVAQVEALDSMLKGQEFDRVLVLEADLEEVVQRLLRRALEQGRTDDTEDVIRRRLEVYQEQTAPLIALYTDRGVVAHVDGVGSVDDVTERITAVLNEH